MYIDVYICIYIHVELYYSTVEYRTRPCYDIAAQSAAIVTWVVLLARWIVDLN